MPKKIKILLWAGIILVVILGIVYWILNLYLENKLVQATDTYEECVKAGYPVLETQPQQCKTPDGKLFVQMMPVSDNQNINNETPEACVDKCGDGVCQEIACLDLECPCAESSASCSEDCLNENGVKYQSEKITEETADYTLDLEYPVIVMTDKNKETIINKKIKALIDKEISGFKKDIGEKVADMEVSFLESGFEFFLLNENFVSLRLSIVSYASGAAHPMNYSVAFNYEVDRDKEIFLDELFKSQPDYLPYLVDYCQLDLKDKLGANLVADGLLPDKANFSLFVLTPESIIFLFDPYQVASYADGPQQSEVFYYQLTDVINDKGAIPRLLGNEKWQNIINRN